MAIDLNNGKTLWTATLENPSVSGVRIIDNWAYKSDQYPNGRYSTMYRYNIQDGTREEVFRITRKEHGNNIYEPDLKLPVKWITPNGDELLVMHNRSYGRGVNERGRMDILAYNLTADSMEWYRKGLDENSSSSGAAISGDNVYFYGTWHAYCIDPATGDTKWKYDVGISSGGDFNTANILIVDDKLIVKQENFKMTAVDKETGKKIWHNPQTAPSPHLLTAHNDTIWMASGGILAIDANTGKVFFNWNNDGKGWWSNPVLPHPTNGYIYTTDGDYIYCLDPKHLK
jgi:outer membrane protein assembly factor BamB